MGSKFAIKSSKIFYRLIPKSLLRLVKSISFIKKHFSPILLSTRAILPQELSKAPPVIVLIGHTSYLESEGGTEKIIINQAEDLLSKGKNSIFIYPKQEPGCLKKFREPKYGVIFNGYELLALKESQLLAFFQQLTIQEIHIHHLLNWPLLKFARLLSAFKGNSGLITYLHDFYFFCPKVNRFCLSGAARCKKSYYPRLIHKWRSLFHGILELSDEIRVPSEFMKLQVDQALKQKTKVFNPSSEVLSLETKPTIAYLGVDSPIKGYDTWLRLTKNALITRKYNLIHLGRRSLSIPHVPLVEYSFRNSKEDDASTLLKTYNVSFVLLWSRVPESYSFTFHEARNAHKTVITSSNSGNIAYEISKNQNLGVVLMSEYQLIQFLLGMDIKTLGTPKFTQ